MAIRRPGNGVAGSLEGVSDGPLVEVEAFAAGGGAVDAAAGMVTPGEELGPGG